MGQLEYMNCPTCGCGLREIKEDHKIGCQDCLVVFREEIERILTEKLGCITYAGQYIAKKQTAKEEGKEVFNNEGLKKEEYVGKNDKGGAVKSACTKDAKEEIPEAELARKWKSARVLEFKQLLEKAVEKEDYEVAIYFRNEIQKLEQE